MGSLPSNEFYRLWQKNIITLCGLIVLNVAHTPQCWPLRLGQSLVKMSPVGWEQRLNFPLSLCSVQLVVTWCFALNEVQSSDVNAARCYPIRETQIQRNSSSTFFRHTVCKQQIWRLLMGNIPKFTILNQYVDDWLYEFGFRLNKISSSMLCYVQYFFTFWFLVLSYNRLCHWSRISLRKRQGEA